jgi:hypothetical protein
VAATSTLQDQLGLAQQGEQRLQQALETARRDFAAELDKLRADGTLAQGFNAIPNPAIIPSAKQESAPISWWQQINFAVARKS